MTRPILYISGPYPGHREIPLEQITGVAEHYRAQAADAGWVAICPSLWPEEGAWTAGMRILERLDPHTDALLALPDWIQDQHAIAESRRAFWRGMATYRARDGLPIPTVEAHMRCPYYRQVHYEISDRDTCAANVERCPDGARCPISERVWRRRVRWR